MMLECLYRIKVRKVLGQRKWTAQKWDLQTIIYQGSIRLTWNKKNIADALDYTHKNVIKESDENSGKK